MAKTTAPLLSFGASGQIGKSLVASKWKGRAYMRRHVVPANPQTGPQTSTRDIFTVLSNIYRAAPAEITDVWDLFATGQVMTARNAFMGKNVKAMRNAGGTADANLNNFVFVDGAKSGPPLGSITATGGALQISVAFTAPSSIPIGWTYSGVIAACIEDGDPASTTAITITALEDPTHTSPIVLAGLKAATLYQVGAWTKWTKPDGTFAYSTNLRDTAATT
jgi:hypothetical protein